MGAGLRHPASHDSLARLDTCGRAMAFRRDCLRPGVAVGSSVDDVIAVVSNGGRPSMACASAARDDFYQKSYPGLYRVRCERFYIRNELTADGRTVQSIVLGGDATMRSSLALGLAYGTILGMTSQ